MDPEFGVENFIIGIETHCSFCHEQSGTEEWGWFVSCTQWWIVCRTRVMGHWLCLSRNTAAVVWYNGLLKHRMEKIASKF